MFRLPGMPCRRAVPDPGFRLFRGEWGIPPHPHPPWVPGILGGVPPSQYLGSPGDFGEGSDEIVFFLKEEIGGGEGVGTPTPRKE